jgi:hypothetical protein
MMKTLTAVAIAAAMTAGAAHAQPAVAPAPAPAAPAAAAPAAGKINVTTTLIQDVIKNPAAKAALEKAVPEIAPYYDQIGGMTLTDLAPMSQGALDDAKLKALQAEFDKL